MCRESVTFMKDDNTFPYNQTSIVEYTIILLLVYELLKPSLYVLIITRSLTKFLGCFCEVGEMGIK